MTIVECSEQLDRDMYYIPDGKTVRQRQEITLQAFADSIREEDAEICMQPLLPGISCTLAGTEFALRIREKKGGAA